MTSAYSRSASEPRERRSYPRETRERGGGGTSFWNPSAPRNIDGDSWRRDPAAEHPASRGPHPSRGNERDRSRGRMERPPSRGSATGEYRPRDFPNGGSRYPVRGRGRGRGGRGEGPMGDMNGRSAGGAYRGPHPRYGQASGQGTQFFAPLTAPPVEGTRFNAGQALSLFSERWEKVYNEMNDKSLAPGQKPTVYKADTTSSSVWDQPKVHVQATVTDFLSELKAALERDQKSQTEVETDPSQQSEA